VNIRQLYMRRQRLIAFAMLLTLAVGGCQMAPDDKQDGSARGVSKPCDGDAGATNNTRLATVEQLIADGKHYAALAELDAIGATTQKATWLRAEALRRIDHVAESVVLYNSLIGSCLEGRAQHGLGLAAAKLGQGARAIDNLNRARQLLPTDPRVRNDLGYALLLDRRWDAAQFEFLTVLDLSPQDPLAARNLVLLAFAQGKADTARALAEKFKMDAAMKDRLALQAASLMYSRSSKPEPMPMPTESPAAPPQPDDPALPTPPLTSPASDAS
jgi:Flp pilus assembly protein TadD